MMNSTHFGVLKTMECNIDERGVRFRRTWGIMNLLVAFVVAGLAIWSGIWWLWIIAAVGASAGAFVLDESRKKWCALRAMGVKTKV